MIRFTNISHVVCTYVHIIGYITLIDRHRGYDLCPFFSLLCVAVLQVDNKLHELADQINCAIIQHLEIAFVPSWAVC